MKIKLLIVAIIFLFVGAFAGFLWAGQRFRQLEVAKEVDVAAQAAMDERTLKLLRLNQTTDAIKELEQQMDSAVFTLATWDNLTDNRNRLRRDKWLKTVKAYYQNYPAKGEDADTINAFLAKIPGSNPAAMNATPQ